jgi:3-oxoacyl-[acyl-carrier-protein] synthase-3
MSASILGLAHRLPPEEAVDGVKRPIARAPGGSSDLVLEPARDALAQAGLAPGELDLLVFATMTPDVTFPGAACYLQDKLECETVGSLDVRGQCTGFLVGLAVADSFLAAGSYRRVLLAAAEVHSAGLDYSPRGLDVARLYGDGAAALVLGAAEPRTGATRERAGEFTSPATPIGAAEPRTEAARERAGGGLATLTAVVFHADGRHYDRFWCEYPSSRQHPFRITAEALEGGRHYPALDFDSVRQFGCEKLPEAVTEVLAASGVGAAEVDCFILSHILPEVVETGARCLGVPSGRWLDAGAAHGHLTAATLPVALSEAVESGRIGKGARVCLAACGAGFTWGAALLAL